jgi:uridine phosphorylase
MPARLRPTAPIASDAILVGDPGRALLLAQKLLEQPKMSNHARGLWGYSGATPAGEQLTIQATGMGGPSATVVLADLAELGVRRAIRIGTCTSMGRFALGDLVIVTKAAAAALHTKGEAPDPDLATALRRELGEEARAGAVVSLDALHRHDPSAASLEGDVADMQTAALLAAGERRGIAIAVALIVAEVPGVGELEDEALASAAKRAGVAAAAVLST